MGESDAKAGMAIEHTTEDQLGGGDGRLQRDSDEVLEVIGAHPVGSCDRALIGVKPDREISPLEVGPNRLQRRVVDVRAIDVRPDLHPPDAGKGGYPLDLD